jgi:2-oxoglutarate ferredoxin oxidoreductase subunit alpha
MKEAVDTISRYKRIAMIHFSEIYPLPSLNKWNYLDIMRGAHLALCVENNAGRQFARLIKAETGYEFNGWINRYDGRPFTVESIVEEINGYTG